VFIPLPGWATAVYNSTGLAFYLYIANDAVVEYQTQVDWAAKRIPSDYDGGLLHPGAACVPDRSDPGVAVRMRIGDG
jgi:hypothetical protein